MPLNSSETHERASWKRLSILMKEGFHRKTIIFLPIIVAPLFLMLAAFFVFIVLLALVAVHGKLSKEDSFTDLVTKLSFTEWGMAFGVGAGLYIGTTLDNIDFGLESFGLSSFVLGIVIGAAIGLLFGAVLDARKTKKSLKET